MHYPANAKIGSILWLAPLLLAGAVPRATSGQTLDGVWDIAMIVADGRVLDAIEIRRSYSGDGRMTIGANTITLLAPQTMQPHQLPIRVDSSQAPATIDVALAGNNGGHGVVMVNGSAAMICLAAPNKPRATAFTSQPGTGSLLVSLTRVGAGQPGAPAAPAPVVPQPPPMTLNDDQLRTALVGTWGHQDNDTTRLMTLNGDGTMSAVKTWKDGLKNIFHTDTRSSGTWKVQGGVVIVQMTASTDKDLRGQIFSYRIRSINDKELLAADPNGQIRQEWKAPTP